MTSYSNILNEKISVIDSNTTIYVSTTGSDTTGDGTSGSPFASPSMAMTYLKTKKINADATVTVQLADGTYNDLDAVNYVIISNRIVLQGNPTTPSNVTLNFKTGAHGIYATAGSYLIINGIKVVGYDTSEWKTGIAADNGSTVFITNCTADGWGVGYQALKHGNLICTGANHTVTNCTYGLNGYAMGNVYFYGSTISYNTTGIQANEGGKVLYSNSNTSFISNGTNTSTAGSGEILVGS